jgi:AcrR family transcriptional regulator
MARTMDPALDDAIAAAAFALLTEHGFAGMTMEGVATLAHVGKPAIYRRFNDKAALVAAVIVRQLPAMDVSDLGSTRDELWRAVQQGLPRDGPAYVRLIGGLIAEEDRHPDLIDGFRRHVLHPRRAAVCSLIERGKERGDVRAELDPERAVDFLAGAFLARVFAGIDTGPRWRKATFETWWQNIRETQQP